MHLALFLLSVFVCWERTHCVDPCNCGLGSGTNICCRQSRPVVTTSTSSGCGCGSSNACSPLVVRPQPLPSIDLEVLSKPRVVCQQVPSIAPLKPVGDLCSCKKTIVTPAIIPKPACGCASSSPCGAAIGGVGVQYGQGQAGYQQIAPSNAGLTSIGTSCSAAVAPCSAPVAPCSAPVAPCSAPVAPCSSGVGPAAPIEVPACGLPVLPKKGTSFSYIPADAVSQEIAYKSLAQQSRDRAERKLSYGFVKLPQEVAPCKKSCKFPEGNYQVVKGPILEFKYRPDELVEDDDFFYDDDCVDAPVGIRQPTLPELGYGVANFKPSTFVNVQGTAAVATPCNSQPIASGSCGYKPGQVIIKTGPVDSGIPSSAVSSGRACADDDSVASYPARPTYYPAASYPNYATNYATGAATNYATGVVTNYATGPATSCARNVRNGVFLRKLTYGGTCNRPCSRPCAA